MKSTGVKLNVQSVRSVVFSVILVPIISTKEILEKNGGYPTLPPSTFCHLRRSLFSTQDMWPLLVWRVAAFIPRITAKREGEKRPR